MTNCRAVICLSVAMTIAPMPLWAVSRFTRELVGRCVERNNSADPCHAFAGFSHLTLTGAMVISMISVIIVLAVGAIAKDMTK